MKVPTLIRGPICAVLCAALSGCVTYTTANDPPRTEVTFQSAAGAKMFYEAYLYRYYNQSTRPKISVGLEFRLPYSHYEANTDSVYFNQAVAAADKNRDGVISDDEARAYSESVLPRPPKIIPVVVAKGS